MDARPSHPFWLLIVLAPDSVPVFAERLPIKVYTTADGLANNAINRIVRDSRGFLWFCTSDGLSRWPVSTSYNTTPRLKISERGCDGYTFTNYGTDQGLPHREVSDYLETREGEFWVATSACLVRFNPKAPAKRRVVYADETGPRTPPMFTVVAPEGEDLKQPRD